MNYISRASKPSDGYLRGEARAAHPSSRGAGQIHIYAGLPFRVF